LIEISFHFVNISLNFSLSFLAIVWLKWQVTTGDWLAAPYWADKNSRFAKSEKIYLVLFTTQLSEFNAFSFSVIVPLKVKNGMLICLLFFLHLSHSVWFDQLSGIHSFYKQILSTCYESWVWMSVFEMKVNILSMDRRHRTEYHWFWAKEALPWDCTTDSLLYWKHAFPTPTKV
jgi:hypothetical protein